MKISMELRCRSQIDKRDSHSTYVHRVQVPLYVCTLVQVDRSDGISYHAKTDI